MNSQALATFLLVIATLSGATLSGCANGPSGRGRMASWRTMQGNSGGISAFGPGTAACGANNIVPREDIYLDGTQFYRACWVPGSTQQIRLRGRPQHGNNVCVFPAQVQNGSTSQTLLLARRADGTIFYDCGALVDLEATIDLQITGANYLLLVEPYGNQLAQMLNCLGQNSTNTQNISACPAEFSGGFLPTP